jgi:protocatechuate 3,4-dioxygenase, alpha subunit
MTTLGLTPSQTVGPFLLLGLHWPDGPDVVPENTSGAVWLRGRVLDGVGEPVPDALVETWQAAPDGRFAHPDDSRGHGTSTGFRGFGRCPTDEQGRWAVRTLKPGRVPAPDGRVQAPHVDVTVLARGLLDRVVTRIYFPDEAEANASDPVLTSIREDAPRATLVARPADDGYVFDIRLQGEGETVFFDV